MANFVERLCYPSILIKTPYCVLFRYRIQHLSAILIGRPLPLFEQWFWTINFDPGQIFKLTEPLMNAAQTLPLEIPFLTAICWQVSPSYLQQLEPLEILKSYERGWEYLGVLAEPSPDE